MIWHTKYWILQSCYFIHVLYIVLGQIFSTQLNSVVHMLLHFRSQAMQCKNQTRESSWLGEFWREEVVAYPREGLRIFHRLRKIKTSQLPHSTDRNCGKLTVISWTKDSLPWKEQKMLLLSSQAKSLVPILNQINPVYTFRPHFFNIYFNVIFQNNMKPMWG